jgi:HAD superfamily hydrolase (TIGR01509 family)
MILKQIGILWDMDGTLIDSIKLHYESWHQAFETIDIKITYEQFKETFGSNNHRVISSFLGYQPEPSLFEELANLKESLFRKLAAQYAQPFPGVMGWLRYFAEQGIKQGIASSAPPENIDTIVDVFQLNPYFDVILSGIHLPSKPDPAIFLKAASDLNYRPESCVVVEDSIAGLDAGKAAGMLTVGLSSTYPREVLDADLIIDDFLGYPEDFHREISRLLQERSKIQD